MAVPLSEEREKRRQAALKAWETIRRKQREKRAEGVEKLTNFIDIEKIGKITHPEVTQEDFEESWSILPGVYFPLGENIIFKTGLEFGKDMDSMRANVTLMYRF